MKKSLILIIWIINKGHNRAKPFWVRECTGSWFILQSTHCVLYECILWWGFVMPDIYVSIGLHVQVMLHPRPYHSLLKGHKFCVTENRKKITENRIWYDTSLRKYKKVRNKNEIEGKLVRYFIHGTGYLKMYLDTWSISHLFQKGELSK